AVIADSTRGASCWPAPVGRRAGIPAWLRGAAGHPFTLGFRLHAAGPGDQFRALPPAERAATSAGTSAAHGGHNRRRATREPALPESLRRRGHREGGEPGYT